MIDQNLFFWIAAFLPVLLSLAAWFLFLKKLHTKYFALFFVVGTVALLKAFSFFTALLAENLEINFLPEQFASSDGLLFMSYFVVPFIVFVVAIRYVPSKSNGGIV
jgi:hypothetical protein